MERVEVDGPRAVSSAGLDLMTPLHLVTLPTASRLRSHRDTGKSRPAKCRCHSFDKRAKPSGVPRRYSKKRDAGTHSADAVDDLKQGPPYSRSAKTPGRVCEFGGKFRASG
ncbi:hypothetical protein L1887_50163 [Cichorium endivia]|nr:hypothetical protein L1887_50163 [Cichorium endivia]